MRRREEERIGARNEIALRGGERRPVRRGPSHRGSLVHRHRLALLNVLGQFPYDCATRTTASTVAVQFARYRRRVARSIAGSPTDGSSRFRPHRRDGPPASRRPPLAEPLEYDIEHRHEQHARNVDVIIPPNTAVPSARRLAAPAPSATTSGYTPRMNAKDVIRIGRKRNRAASTPHRRSTARAPAARVRTPR